MREKREYLPKLLKYIEIANNIPVDCFFPDRRYVSTFTYERLESSNCTHEDVIETYRELLKDFPKYIFDSIFEKSVSDLELETIQDRVDHFAAIKHGIGFISQAVSDERFGEETINEILRNLDDFAPVMLSFIPVSISVNDKGLIELKTNEFFEFLTSNKIEARRIRICDVCYKYFWATRLDKWTCSKSCGNKLRQRNWQSKNKNDYNEKRRENYAYRKQIKLKKENKNGTI